MASPPPSQVEDQTDEDFFDKLVDEDFGITGSSLVDGGESDDAKTFANLSVSDVGPVLEESGDSGLNSEGVDRSESLIMPSSDGASDKDILIGEESISLVSTNSFSTVTELGNSVSTTTITTTTDAVLDSTTSKSSGSRGTSVKEVDWSAFNTELGQHTAGRVGSYSDLFTGLADSSEDPFETAGNNLTADFDPTTRLAGNLVADSTASLGSSEHQTADGQDLHSSQYWESLYPGWRYDPVTCQWHQLDGYDAKASTQVVFQDQAQSAGNAVVADQRSEVSYLQQTAQSVMGTLVENCTTGSVSNWNQVAQGSSEYPANMVFDPQYPGWYYDMIKQEWCLLESYIQALQTTSTIGTQQIQKGHASSGSFSEKVHGLYNEFGQFEQHKSQNQGGQTQGGDWAGTASNYGEANAWQSQPVSQSGAVRGFTGNQQMGNLYGTSGHVNSYPEQQIGFNAMENVSMHGQANQAYDSNNGVVGFQSFPSTENLYHFNEPKLEQIQQTHFSPDYYGNQNTVNYAQQPFHAGNASHTQFSYAPKEGWPSAGRPPHALVTFGFGGKLVVMKDTSTSYASQGTVGSTISILNLTEVIMDKINASATSGAGAFDYFRALCHQSFPGPLVGGNAATKELYKWVDERIANCQSPNMDIRNGELLRLLFCLLKISCQHYGKLRSPFGVDLALQENDGPESAVTQLFASARRTGARVSKYGAITPCLQNMPSEGQIKAAAVEVQNLLVSGRRKEALQCAQEGQLWGPALVLAAQLGEKFYVETVKQMARHQFVSGSPLRTLCLLIAGQPADVFSADSSTSANPSNPLHISQQPTQFHGNSMLDDWEENLAIITANRTKDDELVIIHLGDCLWKERGEIAAAHTCYLVAEANFESYSDSARLCLIGADHWKFPRTYASPEAIQRTELYEYSKVLGNSQFILLPFQPYKLIYAYMLAEIGRVSDSLKYCQAMLKTLKNSSRGPEAETWKSLLLSLEERIRTHQQGGYSTNSAPAKLVGKLFTSIDRSIHRMIGAPPPPMSPASQGGVQSNQQDNHQVAPKIGNSQSTMVMSSLMPSASMEPISEWAGDGNRMSVTNRSISEPDFGRSPKQVDASKEVASTGGKASVAGGPSRFGRFGSQLLQKTMGWVSKSRSDRQAKLGEPNKFYYDENRRRWVEEGVEPPAEEAALPPPPTTASFQNGTPDYTIDSGSKAQGLPPNGGPETKSPNPLEHSSGLPPIPPSSNQFSARGRMGVRSRYVDTFNKGGGTPTNLFQSPSVPVAKSVGSAKFFVPTPAASLNQTVDATGESIPEASSSEDPSTSVTKESSFSSQSSSPSPMQRFPSMDNLTPLNRGVAASKNGNASIPSHSRAASWGGSISDSFNTNTSEIKPRGEALGMPPLTFMPGDPSSVRPNDASLMNSGGNFGDDLHEVEL
ncbi:protein transport protein SEC16A homolog [Magnolia sinica]|uniref:protein transport protein SEC16A homolog n=1 Tax=Magnolia sinica TaxID=86752 RepID=UPI0026586137|nr:protein transport protein SEC16A homolog [Magnolia sinica]XP_058104466.1 protein transport protein SEC16A homolog [Magnolia sinica]XP_058104467.1 protein transport protein SEC16A homolog [Magnolia sinica]